MYRFPKVAFSPALLLSVLLPNAAKLEYRAAIEPELAGIAYYGAVERGAGETTKDLPRMEATQPGAVCCTSSPLL